MAIVDALLPEFDHEMAVTRKVLERVDGAQFGWQPHEKSMSLGRLATHVAEIPKWGQTILTQTEFNMVDGEYKPTAAATTARPAATWCGSWGQATSQADPNFFETRHSMLLLRQ